MKIAYVDELFITTPMSQEERFKLLKKLQEGAYLQGIDKGTELERDTKIKLENIREQKIRKEFNEVFDRLTEYIHIGVRRHKRAKYKGRYPKKKKPSTSVPIQKDVKPTASYTKLPPWLNENL